MFHIVVHSPSILPFMVRGGVPPLKKVSKRYPYSDAEIIGIELDFRDSGKIQYLKPSTPNHHQAHESKMQPAVEQGHELQHGGHLGNPFVGSFVFMVPVSKLQVLVTAVLAMLFSFVQPDKKAALKLYKQYSIQEQSAS